jgi:DNA polymerase-3 subunit delta'
MTGAFNGLVGQDAVASELAAAAASDAPAHAWLLTGPPGSGRSVAARAFAAALECSDAGCGDCQACRTARAGSHPDVEVVTPGGLSLGVDFVRGLVRRAALAPSVDSWQVIVVEDADRLTEQAANALLKSLEEPPGRGIWLLCAPSVDDVLPTIRSRCRVVALRLPPADAVARMLVERDGVDEQTARAAAHAAQGHIGRARRLATDPEAARRRRDVLGLPGRVASSVPACFAAADTLVKAADAEAKALIGERDAAETAALKEALGAEPDGAKPRGTAGAFKQLEGEQKSRATRTKRDALDRALIDLASFYRDVLAVQLGGSHPVPLVNVDATEAVGVAAQGGSAESSLRRMQAVLAAREAIEANAAPLLAVEDMALRLHQG